MIHQLFLSGQQDALVTTSLVSLKSCYIVFHFCPRGNIAVSLSSNFLLDKWDSSTLPLPEMPWCYTVPGWGVGECHLFLPWQKVLCQVYGGYWQDQNKSYLSSEQSCGDFLAPMAAKKSQDQAGTLCSGSFILFFPLSVSGTKVFFQRCPFACSEMLASELRC